jgi:hypothetical protein
MPLTHSHRAAAICATPLSVICCSTPFDSWHSLLKRATNESLVRKSDRIKPRLVASCDDLSTNTFLVLKLQMVSRAIFSSATCCRLFDALYFTATVCDSSAKVAIDVSQLPSYLKYIQNSKRPFLQLHESFQSPCLRLTRMLSRDQVDLTMEPLYITHPMFPSKSARWLCWCCEELKKIL